MTVLVGDDLYKFELENAAGSAALSVKLTDGAAVTHLPPVGAAKESVAPVGGTEVDKQAVIDARPLHHPEKLQSLFQLGKEATLLQVSSPELYQGYEGRKVSNVS